MPEEGADHPFPSFPFWARDWLSSATVTGLTLAEQGAYVRLLCHQWLDGSIPDDPAKLARLCGVSLREFRRIWTVLAPCFQCKMFATSGLNNRRLEDERARLTARFRRRSNAGKTAANSRWRRDLEEKEESGGGMRNASKPHKNRNATAVRKNASPLHITHIEDTILKDRGAGGESEAAELAPEKPPETKQQACIRRVWEIYDEVQARRPTAGVIGKWRQVLGDDDRLLALLRDLAPRGVLTDKGSAYVFAAVSKEAKGGERQNGSNGSAVVPLPFVAGRPTRPVAGFTDEFLAQAIQDQIELDKLSV